MGILSLCAPVTVELDVSAGEENLSSAQWVGLVAKFAEYVNEFKVAGLETLPIDSRTELLNALDEGKKFYHLIFKDVPVEELNLLSQLRQREFFGSLIVDYLPEEAEVDDNERYERLRDFIEKSLSVGLEVNVSVALRAWACEHLTEIVESASDLGVNHIICDRIVENGCDVVRPFLLAKALSSFLELRDLSYSISLGNCVPNCFCNTDSRGCLGGIVSAAVNAKGELLPCRCSSEPVGNLLDSELTEIWNSEIMEAWRQRLPQPCASCSKSELCPGGCRAISTSAGACDPLIGNPFPEEVETLHEVVLEEDLCPKPRYVARPEKFGWALIRANQVIPVSAKAGKILSLFDGKHSLADIERKCGAVALPFIYSLYVRGFVEFSESTHI